MPELLDSMSSAELTELRAYELLNGPIGPQYIHESLAALHEMLQQICRLLIAQNAEDEDDIPEIQPYPRARLMQFEEE